MYIKEFNDMQINRRRLKVLINNILSYPFRLKNNISLSAILQNSELDKHIFIGHNVKFYRSSLGAYSTIQYGSFISDCSIGKYSSIANGCYIGGAAHPIEWGGTSLHFYCTQREEEGIGNAFYKRYFNPFKQTVIGNDVWIGANAMIEAGVKIGDGAVIGMGSVVTKNVGAYEIWAGNPARFIRKRFDDNICQSLSEIKWWEKDDHIVRSVSQYINQPSVFVNKLRAIEKGDAVQIHSNEK